jgi:undecaprenyl-diphosphatase
MLSIPTIFGALVLLIIEMQSTLEAFNYTNLIIGFFISMIIAFLTIKLFLNFVERIGMIPFVIYRIILGVFLIILI